MAGMTRRRATLRPLPESLRGQRVRVYWNTSRRCWSVLHQHRLAGHAQLLRLGDVRFLVLEKGRDRVRATGKKEVHAFAEGVLLQADLLADGTVDIRDLFDFGVRVAYSPHDHDTFVTQPSGHPIVRAALAGLSIDLYPNGKNRPVVLALVSGEPGYPWDKDRDGMRMDQCLCCGAPAPFPEDLCPRCAAEAMEFDPSDGTEKDA